MKNILLTFILLIANVTAFASDVRSYSLSLESIDDVKFEQRYTAKVVYCNIGNTQPVILSDKEFKFIGFTDTAGYVKDITCNSTTLYIEFYRRETSARINGVININFKAKASNDADDLTLHSLELPYYYSALKAVDPGKIAGPSGYYRTGEVPGCIKSIYDAIPLSGTTVTYSWEKRLANGTWSTIQGESEPTLVPHAMGLVSVLYRRKATDSDGSYAYSNTVEVLPILTAGEIGLSYTDTGSTLTLTNVVSPNSTNADITWQSSTDLNGWMTILGNGVSLTTDKPDNTTYFRRIVTTLANDAYGNPIKDVSNIVCYFKGTPAGLSIMSHCSADSAVTDIIYYDGLGRKLQSVSAKAAMDGKDIVSTYRYDNKGRESGAGVPFCIAGNGEFAHNAAYKSGIYHGDSRAYTTLLYENSPLDRLTASYKPGEVYQNNAAQHCITTIYGVNDDNEVWMLQPTGCGFRVTGHHAAATLYRRTYTDEDGAQVEFFTDTHGKTILERRKAANNGNADTYYVYDGKERVCCVVSPVASAMLTLNTLYSDTCSLSRELCFIYRYDNEDRIVMKRLPGRCAEFFGYDTHGRLTTYYDESMLQEGITKSYTYDALGRPVGFRINGNGGPCCQQWNHYDDYSHSNVVAFAAVDGVVERDVVTDTVKGLITYERTFELYNNWASEVRERTYYYDRRGRCVQTVTSYPLGISCRTSVKYDYAGNPLKTVEHYSGSYNTLTVLTERTFDSRGRKLTEQTFVDGCTVANAAFEYDELGRVTRTTLNGCIDITACYNLQGWMTALLATKTKVDGTIEKVLFDETLHYYNTTDDLATPLYAGRIAQIDWHRKIQLNGNDRFLYRYDPLGRLVKAEHRIARFAGSTAGNYCEQTGYDLNCNITSFNAVKESGNVQLEYALNGNRIVGAGYDCRGNITTFPGKNLHIEYNLINLPQSIAAADGKKTNYSYMSDGTKFRAVSETGVNFLYTGSLRWRIQDGTITPESFAVAGGRATFDGDGWQTHYYITDHLGSTRAVTNASGDVLATFDYTPYGELLAASDSTSTGTDYLFTGKENQAKQGVGELYDSQARFMDTGGRFLSIDPLAEKYYHLSPYTYCAGDPVNLVDPEGRKIKITGKLYQEALNGLEYISGLDLELDKGNYLFIKDNLDNTGGYYNLESELLARIINDNTICVNIRTLNTQEIVQDINHYVLVGSFYGNIYDKNSNVVYALQIVDPIILNSISSVNSTPGADMLHEVSEAYEGALIAKKESRSIGNSKEEPFLYKKAHERAYPQSGKVKADLIGNNIFISVKGKHIATITFKRYNHE